MTFRLVILSALVLTSGLAFAKRSEGPAPQSKKQIMSVVLDENNQPLCAHIFSKAAAIDIGIPSCQGENLSLVQAVSPDGVKTAFLTHFAAFVIGCTGGVVVDLNTQGMNSPTLQTPSLEVGALVAVASITDPSGHAFVAGLGVITCGIASKQIRTYFAN